MEHTLNEHHELRKEYKTSEKAFVVLMVLIWTRYTVLNFITVILRTIPVLQIIADSAITISIVVSIFVALPYFSRRISVADVFFYCLMFAIVLVSSWLYTENSEYIAEDFGRMVWNTFPIYFLGVAYSHELCKKTLFWASLAGTCAFYAYQLYNVSSGVDMASDNMDASYKVLPSILYLIFCIFEYRKLWAIPFVIVGFLLILSYGTRGPLIIMLIFAGYYAVSYIFRNGSFFVKLLAVLLIGFAVYCYLFDNILSDFAEYLIPKFEKAGLDTRILELFLDGDIIDHDSGRDDLQDTIKAIIWDKPVFGHGLMGDRVILGDRYVHNIAYEIFCHFGVIFGSIIIVALVINPVRAVIRTDSVELRSFIIMLSCMVFVKLWVTGSYLYESYLFLLYGLAVATLRRTVSIFKR